MLAFLATAGTVALGASPALDARLAQIKTISETPGVLWRTSINSRFASEPPGASKTLCGVKGDWRRDIAAAIDRGDITRFKDDGSSNEEIPESFDSATNWPHCAKTIGDIRDQSNCGCCWAFGAASAASDRMCIATNGTLLTPLSAQDVCFCASRDGCNGGDIMSPWDYIKDSGAVSGGQYHGTGPFGKGFCSDFSLPHCHHHGPQGDDPYPAEGEPGCPSASSPRCPRRCDASAVSPHDNFANDKYSFDGHVQTASGEGQIKRMIIAGGPVETAFDVYSDFENYAGGIYHPVTGEMVGGHAVKIVGWGSENGVKYWKIANSWNPHWGENGYFRIRVGSSGVDDQVTGSDAQAQWKTGGSSLGVVV